MRILVVGSGGREHALAWAIAASPLVDRVYCAPGNAGIADDAECVPIGAMDLPAIVAAGGDKATRRPGARLCRSHRTRHPR